MVQHVALGVLRRKRLATVVEEDGTHAGLQKSRQLILSMLRLP